MTIDLAYQIILHLLALPGLFVTIEGVTYWLDKRRYK